MELNKETLKWLDDFAKFHRLKSREEAIYALIKIHKVCDEIII